MDRYAGIRPGISLRVFYYFVFPAYAFASYVMFVHGNLIISRMIYQAGPNSFIMDMFVYPFTALAIILVIMSLTGLANIISGKPGIEHVLTTIGSSVISCIVIISACSFWYYKLYHEEYVEIGALGLQIIFFFAMLVMICAIPIALHFLRQSESHIHTSIKDEGCRHPCVVWALIDR